MLIVPSEIARQQRRKASVLSSLTSGLSRHSFGFLFINQRRIAPVHRLFGRPQRTANACGYPRHTGAVWLPCQLRTGNLEQENCPTVRPLRQCGDVRRWPRNLRRYRGARRYTVRRFAAMRRISPRKEEKHAGRRGRRRRRRRITTVDERRARHDLAPVPVPRIAPIVASIGVYGRRLVLKTCEAIA